jgi:hypothetical protein
MKMVGNEIKEEGNLAMTDSIVSSWLGENSSLGLHLGVKAPTIWSITLICRALMASSCVVRK